MVDGILNEFKFIAHLRVSIFNTVISLDSFAIYLFNCLSSFADLQTWLCILKLDPNRQLG